jgi:hypothetical protein
MKLKPMHYLLIVIVALMAALGFLAVSLYQKELVKEAGLKNQLSALQIENGRLASEVTAASSTPPMPENDQYSFNEAETHSEMIEDGLYWVSINRIPWLIDENQNPPKAELLQYRHPYNIYTGYTTSTDGGYFTIDWSGYGPGEVADFYDLKTRSYAFSLGYRDQRQVLSNSDKTISMELQVEGCDQVDPSASSSGTAVAILFHEQPATGVSQKDIRVDLPTKHPVICETNDEEGGVDYFPLKPNQEFGMTGNTIQPDGLDEIGHVAKYKTVWGEVFSIDYQTLDATKIKFH